jgi:hypothetical protein
LAVRKTTAGLIELCLGMKVIPGLQKTLAGGYADGSALFAAPLI